MTTTPDETIKKLEHRITALERQAQDFEKKITDIQKQILFPSTSRFEPATNYADKPPRRR